MQNLLELNELIELSQKILLYFPVKLLISGAFFSFIFLEFNFLEPLEEQILLGLLQFLQVPAYYLDGGLFIGSIYSAEQFMPPTYTHTLFLIFFCSVALVTHANITIRLKFLFYGFLCFLSFIVIQLALILIMNGTGTGTSIGYLHSSIVFSGLAAGIVIEIALLKIITLPKSKKIKPIVKRTYVDEYIYLAALIIFSSLLIYAIFNILDIREDTVVSAYVALGLSSILTFKYYLSYLIWELKKPIWASFGLKTNFKRQKWKVSFLLPAFNEEKTIKKLIESIDKAASNYEGETEIVLVNDGSTDDTEKFAKEALGLLKFSKGRIYTIKNSGKGFALHYGLQKLTGDIILRIDSDSIVDEKIIVHVVRHYDNPTVGSVSGMIFPIEEKSIWQKCMVFLACLNIFYRKGQYLIDAILVQPGAFSTFRTDAMRKVGGWSTDQFGEDGEVTMRLGRYGYRNVFEEHAKAYSDAPKNIHELREQRVRWAIAFYHSRAKNINIVKEFNGPRSIMVLLNLFTHGGGFGQLLFWPFLAVSIFLDDTYSILNFAALLGIPLKLIVIDVLIFSLLYVVYIYYLYRFKKLYLVKYLPFMRIYLLIISTMFKPEAMEVLLQYSSKWNRHTKESNDDLRKIMKKPV